MFNNQSIKKEIAVNNVERKEVILHILYSIVCRQQGRLRCTHDEAFLEWCAEHESVIEGLVTTEIVKQYGNAVIAEDKMRITQDLAEKFLEGTALAA